MSNDTEIYFTGVDKNPTNTTLADALLFIYLTLNDSSNLDGPLRFIINYNNTKYNNIKIWSLNDSADNLGGKWQEVDFITFLNGLIKVNVSYVSIFALTEGENQISNINADFYDGDDEKVDNNNYNIKETLIIVFLSSGIVGATSFALYLAKKSKKQLPF